MKLFWLLILVALFFSIFCTATASAQFPKIKIPKITEPKTQPATADTPQAPPGTNSQPTQPENRNGAAGQATEATINKPSIQINLRTHLQYYRGAQEDQETWSWTPRIVYRVNGPIPAGGQLSVEFTLPSGKPWIRYDCSTKETAASYWWETECGVNSSEYKDQDA